MRQEAIQNLIAQAIVVVYFSLLLRRLLPHIFPYKATWGSSLARCCRFAVAPKFLMKSVFVGALTSFFVTGLNGKGDMQAFSFSSYNNE